MIYAVSDIHGCTDKYFALLDKIAFSDSDTLYVLGDVIDRGDGGLNVLFDMEKRKNVIPIIGNHESLALGAMKAMVKFPGEEALERLRRSKTFILWEASGGEPTVKAFAALDPEKKKAAVDYISVFSVYDSITLPSGKFHLSHTLPDYKPGLDIHSVSYLEFIYGEPDYSKNYGSGEIFVTGHTPTGLIDPDHHGRILRQNGHVAIDCAASYGGRLGCIRLDDLEEFYV